MSCGPGSTPSLVVESPSAAPPAPGSASYSIIECRINLVIMAPDSLSQQFVDFEIQLNLFQLQDYSGNISYQKTDVNTILQYLGSSAALIEGYKAF